MKFMVHWEIHSDKRTDVLAAFAAMPLEEFQSQQGPDVRIIGRWHDIVGFTGVAICETSDTEALSLWLQKWAPVTDFDVVPVLDDGEAHAAAQKVVAAS